MPNELERRFEGRAVLDELLGQSGTLADTEDVAQALSDALAQGVPATVVFAALWEDEPQFESPTSARRLYANLFGLWELLASRKTVDLTSAGPTTAGASEKTLVPTLTGEPDDAFVEAAWRFLDANPKERERLAHGFENRQDALLSWLDASGLSDAGFGLARHLLCDLFSFLELGGRRVGTVGGEVPELAGPVPEAFARWLDEGVAEEETDEEAPLPPHVAAQVRALTLRAAASLWGASSSARS